MACADGADTTCPVCGSPDCKGFPDVPLPSDYPFLREDQMADHPKTDQRPDEQRSRTRRGRARRRDTERAKPGPGEDREKRHDEDR